MPLNRRLLVSLLSACAAIGALSAPVFAAKAPAPKPAPPRLILQLTVDQLRGDMLPRFHDRFGNGGFRRLMDNGVYFSNAHYGTGNTFTAAGHAVLTTGADTGEHGIVANEWFDRDSGKPMYATFDPAHGMSPLNLTSSTLGDELVAASSGRSRAFAVAGKDRSAIIPGGHLGKAFWFQESGGGGFGSSTYYYQTLPTWAQSWNDGKPVERFRNTEWKLLGERSRYLNGRNAGNEYARGANATLGASFPHSLAISDDKKFLGALRATPFLDEHTLAFAQALIRGEKLGQGVATDYLSISLSGTDYIGHSFGPSSLEYEDNLLRLDANLAAFLTAVDGLVGRDRVVVVLSADHGIADIPELLHAQGYDAERFLPKPAIERLNSALKSRFNVTDDLVLACYPPGFYLDRGKMAALKLDRAAVENALAAELRNVPGVAYVFTRTDLLSGRVGETALARRVARGYHPERGGDVVMIPKQLWYLYHDPEGYAAMHGTPYSYDTFVPLLFYGAGIKAAQVERNVEPGSIAPTLAALLHIKPPSGSSAPVLPEVFGERMVP